eukprot:11608344-Karenia_brevis.AAC.1
MAVETTGSVGSQRQEESNFTGFTAPPQVNQVEYPDHLQMFLANPKPLEAEPPDHADLDDEYEFEQGSDSEGDYDMTIFSMMMVRGLWTRAASL